MLYLEELLDVVIAEEGQTLMGLDFLVQTLDLSMNRIEAIFKKALSEYSERRPMKKTTVINAFDYMTDGTTGYITMPEGTTSCRVARYGVLPNQMPRYMMPKFSEQSVEFDPVTNTCRVWPPVTPLRLTYTQKYMPTTDTIINGRISVPYETDEVFATLPTMFAGKTLSIEKAVVVTDPLTGETTSEIKTIVPIAAEEVTEEGLKYDLWHLAGDLGVGTYNTYTRELELTIDDEYTAAAPIMYNYYPKYCVVKELDIGEYVLTKMFAVRLLQALASLRAQATQSALQNIDLTTDELNTRVQELKKEVREICRSTFSWGGVAPY